MEITLYDLAGADPALRFSPYCWRVRMALAHKDLPVRTVPWRFTEKDRIAFAGTDKVPVIVDGDHVVADSWTIAEYLEDAYPDRPSLFEDVGGRAYATFINAWADSVLNPAILRLVVLDIWRALDPRDQPYFRESREARLGATLEAVTENRAERIAAVRDVLMPLRLALHGQAYIGGPSPNYADYIVFGSLQWPRCVSPLEILIDDSPVMLWRQRMFDLFDGMAAEARTAY